MKTASIIHLFIYLSIYLFCRINSGLPQGKNVVWGVGGWKESQIILCMTVDGIRKGHPITTNTKEYHIRGLTEHKER